MNNQEALDKGYAFLKKQGVKCQINSCCYLRHPHLTSRACWVGGLIPDDVYDYKMESMPLDQIKVKVKCLQDCDIGFLIAGQNIHDVVPVEQWESSYRELAGIWNLAWNF